MTTSTSYAKHPLSTTNEAPTLHEGALLRAQVKDLERQMSRMVQNLAAEESQVQAIATQLDSLKVVLAPVRRLPPEILGEVFLCMPTSEARPANYQATVASMSLVCRSWRHATLLTPRLWCNVWVRAGAPSLYFDTICAWVARARSLAKHLEISSTDCGGLKRIGSAYSDFNEEDISICAESSCLFADPILTELLTLAPRGWHSVALNCPAPNCLQNFASALKNRESQVDHTNWSDIQAFTVGARGWSHWPEVTAPKQLFSFVPLSVASFTLHLPTQNGYVWDDDMWELPLGIPASILQGLKSLDLSFGKFTDISGSSLLTSLQHCASLERLTIDFTCSAISHPKYDTAKSCRFSSAEVVLLKLRYLNLPQFNCGCFDVMKLLRMPALRELHMSLEQDDRVHKIGKRGPTPLSMDSEWDEAPDARDLIDFVRGDRDTESQLLFLHIKAPSFYGGVLFHLLRDLRSLIHVKLEWMELRSYTPEDSFSNLTTHTPPCLPNLKTIEIVNLKHSPDFEIPSLRSFVEERNIDLTLSYHDHEAALEEKKEEDEKYAILDGYDSDEKYWNPVGAVW